MLERISSGLMLALLLAGILASAFNAQPVKPGPATWIIDDDARAIRLGR
jgi:hypothetical protein